MRIVAGKHKGRRIELPERIEHIRPTSDFTRQAAFNILTQGRHGDCVSGEHGLDICCGTGAFGLEALSRGAASVTFIDQSHDAIAVARANAERFGETAASRFVVADATRLPQATASAMLAFLDPPYRAGLLPAMLQSLAGRGWLAPGCMVLAERDSAHALQVPDSFSVLDERRYGRATVTILRFSAADPDADYV